MPKEWYDFHSLVVKDDDNEEIVRRKEFNKRILADKKPYFMIYVYPRLKKEYRDYIKSRERCCQRLWGIKLDELLSKTDRDEKQEEFVRWYHKKNPVFDGDGVMNRLCRYVEREFNGYVHSVKNKEYTFGDLIASKDYSKNIGASETIKRMGQLYEAYTAETKKISAKAKAEGLSDDETAEIRARFAEQFRRDCEQVCVVSERLCDVLLKICYTSENSKRFVWNMCGEQIVANLLDKNKSYFYFIYDDAGETFYRGCRYKKVEKCVKSGDKINELCDE